MKICGEPFFDPEGGEHRCNLEPRHLGLHTSESWIPAELRDDRDDEG